MVRPSLSESSETHTRILGFIRAHIIRTSSSSLVRSPWSILERCHVPLVLWDHIMMYIWMHDAHYCVQDTVIHVTHKRRPLMRSHPAQTSRPTTDDSHYFGRGPCAESDGRDEQSLTYIAGSTKVGPIYYVPTGGTYCHYYVRCY